MAYLKTKMGHSFFSVVPRYILQDSLLVYILYVQERLLQVPVER